MQFTQPFFDSDGDNTAQAMKAAPGYLHKLTVMNPNTAQAFIQLFDAATSAVTVGSTTPDYVVVVPANDGTTDGAVIDDHIPPLHFETAITYACTTTDTGNTDPTTGLIISATFD